jgi:outer membrane protein assembly factor BamB
MQIGLGMLAKLGLASVLAVASAAPAGAEPITAFTGAVHFRTNNGPNSVGSQVGDHVFIGILNVSPTAGTSVSATQGEVTRPVPFTPFTVFPTLFRRNDPYEPSLTGAWSISATNGPDAAGPVLTNAIPNPELLPLAENLQLTGSGATPTLSWTLPDLTGFDVESTRIFVYNDATDDIIANPLLAGTPTQFAIPSGLLVPGVPYVFAVNLNDDEAFGLENRSVAYTQSPYLVDPADVDLLVGSFLTDSVKRYDGVTGAYLGEFVSAGPSGPLDPRGMTIGPDRHLYVASDDLDPSIERYVGDTGTRMGTCAANLGAPYLDVLFGPSGDLYATSLIADFVLRFDRTTCDLVGTIGVGSPLTDGVGLAFGADGNLYVSSYDTNRVLRFDALGAYIDEFATAPLNVGDITFGPDGNLYAYISPYPGGPGVGDVMRFDGTTGASLGSFIPAGDFHPGTNEGFLAFGPDGNLYVADFHTDQVLRYDGSTGAYLGAFASGGGLDGPRGLAFVPEPGAGALLVAGAAFVAALTFRARRRSRLAVPQ